MWRLESQCNISICSYTSDSLTETETENEIDMSLVSEDGKINQWKLDKPQYLLIIGYIRRFEHQSSKIIPFDVYQLCYNYSKFNCRFCHRWMLFMPNYVYSECYKAIFNLSLYFENNCLDIGLNEVCKRKKCRFLSSMFCSSVLKRCGHYCIGPRNHSKCVEQCIHYKCSNKNNNKTFQTSNDLCLLCNKFRLKSKPSIKLECGHYFHYLCIRKRIFKGYYFLTHLREMHWNAICPSSSYTTQLYDHNLNFLFCPLCNQHIKYDLFDDILEKIVCILQDIKNVCIKECQFRWREKTGFKYVLRKSEYRHNSSFDTFWDTNEDEYGIKTFDLYSCSECKKPYLCRNGSKNGCVCVPSDIKEKPFCDIHGYNNMIWKCRYCCNIAIKYNNTTKSYECTSDPHLSNNYNAMQLVDNSVDIYVSYDKYDSCNNGINCPLGIKHPSNGTKNFCFCYLCWSKTVKHQDSRIEDYNDGENIFNISNEVVPIYDTHISCSHPFGNKL
eukprot:227598_1